MADSGYINIFRDVKAPDSSTMPVFKAIFSTYEKGKPGKWYEYHKLPEILRRAGYYQTWVSAQGKRGAFDCIPTRYAQMCDSVIFTNKKVFSTKDDVATDEGILSLIDEFPTRNNKTVDFIHLIGNHTAFDKRFPANRARFNADDYADCPENQREVLAAYDNSVLFNDSIVSEIIKHYADEEAIVIYFSDHGQDLFQSNPNRFGHGTEDPKSFAAGIRVPLMVYMSEKYKSKYPERVAEIENNLHKPVNTTNMIYSIGCSERCSQISPHY